MKALSPYCVKLGCVSLRFLKLAAEGTETWEQQQETGTGTLAKPVKLMVLDWTLPTTQESLPPLPLPHHNPNPSPPTHHQHVRAHQAPAGAFASNGSGTCDKKKAEYEDMQQHLVALALTPLPWPQRQSLHATR